jgi:hypothetical protein
MRFITKLRILSSIPKNIATKTIKTKTMIVEVTTVSLSGQATFFNSIFTSLMNLLIFLNIYVPVRKRLEKRSGRAEGTRTPNSRFWRPVLYQLSYDPLLHPLLCLSAYLYIFKKGVNVI